MKSGKTLANAAAGTSGRDDAAALALARFGASSRSQQLGALALALAAASLVCSPAQQQAGITRSIILQK